MEANSRTAKSIKNSSVALVFYFINLTLQFFSRKIFLDYLGTEVLGLNTTATSLLQFLNIAEMGIGAAVACTLYKPLFEKDTKTISEIVSLQGWFYHRIAWFIIGASAVLMCFFPWIFDEMTLPLWYAYASFSVLLLSSLLGYFLNYKQIVLSANQQDYKIQYSYRTTMLIKTISQMIAIKYLDNGYVWWLVLETLFAFAASIALNRVIRKTCPYLKTHISRGKELSKKYPDVIVKVKQIFVHKINAVAVGQLTPVIIFSFVSLADVAIYGNYTLITTGLVGLFSAMTNGMAASVGNLVASTSESGPVRSVFGQLFTLRYVIVTSCCFLMFYLTPSFITLWVGSEFLLDNKSFIAIVVILYLTMSRGHVEQFTAAYGMFYDVWAAIAEAFSILLFSILGGVYFGLHGILWGTAAGMALFVFGWKPIFLFVYGFKEGIQAYYLKYLLYIVITAGCWTACHQLFQKFTIEPSASLGNFILCGILYFGLFCSLQLCLLALASNDFRLLYKRFFIKKHIR